MIKYLFVEFWVISYFHIHTVTIIYPYHTSYSLLHKHPRYSELWEEHKQANILVCWGHFFYKTINYNCANLKKFPIKWTFWGNCQTLPWLFVLFTNLQINMPLTFHLIIYILLSHPYQVLFIWGLSNVVKPYWNYIPTMVMATKNLTMVT